MTQRSPVQPPAVTPNSVGNALQAREGHDEGFVLVDWVRNNALANPAGLPARVLDSLAEAPVAVRVCTGLVPGLYVLIAFFVAMYGLSMFFSFMIEYLDTL